ncbi:NUDIX hydrolase [Latilactobacillus curvatus]|uniref:ADP-ribose pyrophosphatase n=1 Tax=Latilactobacillus curvatus JCM 1096 = DSM 20019 TaxID=1293592 RepID=A0AAJ0LDR7_LATCU|nr:NUDIX hydrolase [Latilactobacillus curvatus]ANJ69185.1 ADP-ribose pyrophosphatase [Latilactobacillus curvatus]ANY14017.1 ADP-ribose pyrophosphatase [Latilactobacillus curvatus]AOO75671.1 ADP-ribose pyrophosphatase [Latilactobacillus curvatus]KHO11985.1 ADP-ribose pyrophosphatase [Latilactobacillus curvatus]KRK87732.1 ADP-ribose pyrophosphatase [Latilactobacillus curvatus JCM 1096 = DSM 20019]
MDYTEKVLSEETLFKGQIIDLAVQQVALPNGQTASREIVYHHGAVGIIPITADNSILLVRQWRAPMQRETLEIPAGKIDPGEKNLDQVALRELNEETGLTTQKLVHVTDFFSSPGFSNELMTLYYTDTLTPVTHKRSLDDDEFLNVEKLTLEEAQAAVADGLICDAKTIMALYYWQLQAK